MNRAFVLAALLLSFFFSTSSAWAQEEPPPPRPTEDLYGDWNFDLNKFVAFMEENNEEFKNMPQEYKDKFLDVMSKISFEFDEDEVTMTVDDEDTDADFWVISKDADIWTVETQEEGKSKKERGTIEWLGDDSICFIDDISASKPNRFFLQRED